MVDSSLKSTPRRYGSVARWLHLILSVLILLQIAGGLIAVGASPEGEIRISQAARPARHADRLGGGGQRGVVGRVRPAAGAGRRNDACAIRLGAFRARIALCSAARRRLYRLRVAQRLRRGRFPVGAGDWLVSRLARGAGFGAHWLAVMLLTAFVGLHVYATVYHQYFKRDNRSPACGATRRRRLRSPRPRPNARGPVGRRFCSYIKALDRFARP